MPRVKTPQKYWGLHLSLGHELAEHVAKALYPRFFLHRDLTLMLIRVATRPDILTSPKRNADDVLALHRAYARNPDAVLGCLTFLRKTIADWKKYPAGIVRLYLRQHALHWKAEWNGQPVPLSGMDDKDLASNLTLRAGFTITADTVKKARQQITKEDRIYGIFERPEVKQHFRDGGFTPRQKRQPKGRKKAVRVVVTA